MNFSSTTTNIDFNTRMICVIDGDNILEMNTAGQTQVIGNTKKWCDELLEIAQEYKQLCIDNGLIEEEKTPEQIQIELMQQMMAEIQRLNNKVEVLENGHNGHDNPRSKSARGRQSESKSSSDTSDAEGTRSTI